LPGMKRGLTLDQRTEYGHRAYVVPILPRQACSQESGGGGGSQGGGVIRAQAPGRCDQGSSKTKTFFAKSIPR
jgi:hypothetical protein